ncbi:MAG: molecular chaperone TorD family protein [Acidobacteria bacterium]|nr:molecular chaperone TorD family protein [Acidobacteriota bacterium]
MDHTETQELSREELRDEALCRSVLYGVLSLGLYPPTGQTFQELRSETARLALREAAQVLTQSARSVGSAGSVPSGEAENAADLPHRVEDWIQVIVSLPLDVWLTSHGRLFGHTARGQICPYETEYGNEGLFQQPRQLAKITGFYEAFGLTTRSEERERPDHISCELEFLDFLCRKEAWALESGEEAVLEETRKAMRLFLCDHVGRFGRAFAHMLAQQDSQGFFARLGDLLSDFLTLECRRVGVLPGPLLLPLRSAEEDKVPMACGGESELVQIQPSESV